MITVYYDSQCSICRKEISHYQKIAPPNVFIWQDVQEAEQELAEQNITVVDALKQLHVKTADGVFHYGVDAFIVIWQQLKRWHLLAQLVSLPVIKSIVQCLYHRFAVWRFKRLTHCGVHKLGQ